MNSRITRAHMIWATIALSSSLHAAVGEWMRQDLQKSESQVPAEKSIDRRRVKIRQTMSVPNSPGVFRDELELELARKIRLAEKTDELIHQLEQLIRRPGQAARLGELKMRLAELYFDRSRSMAARESESWEKQLHQWEENEGKGDRPVLKTPQADRLRRQALRVYTDLEKMSRGPDQGRSRMIRRDDVLFFLAATLADLGEPQKGRPYYEELVSKFPRSPRVFASRLSLADTLFDSGKFSAAIPHYLHVATGEGAPAGSESEVRNIRSYALYKLGWCYMNTGAFDKAVLAFQRTVESSTDTSSEQRLAFKREALNDLTRAFALAGQYSQGEAWLAEKGYATPELIRDLRRNIVETSRDRGDLKTALANIDRLLKEDPESPEARDLALDRARLIGKKSGFAAYAQALGEFAKNYGTDSNWMDAQKISGEDKKALADEAVAEIRREAKSYHKAAQVRDSLADYKKSRPYYEVYFQVVPNPNADSAENIHEMRFYYAELLYKLQDYAKASEVYAQVGEGKYAQAAAYSRVASLKEAARKDKGLVKDLSAATEAFIQQYPQDERGGDLLYASAYESFEAGSADESMKTLRDIVEKYGDNSRGVESAERILFLQEKQGNLPGVVEDCGTFLGNSRLVKAGGKGFVQRVEDYQRRAQFKLAEGMPEGNPENFSAKAQRFYELAGGLSGDLREKALNNALVYARKGNNQEVQQKAQQALLKEFPKSEFAKDLYLERGDKALEVGQWGEALKNYNIYLKNYGTKKDSATESARWNVLYMRAGLEGYWEPAFRPSRDLSAGLVKDLWAYWEDFPKTPHREQIMTWLAFRQGAREGDLVRLKKSSGLKGSEKDLLAEAALVLEARSTRQLAGLSKKYPPAAAKTDLLKAILAQARFESVEADFRAYTKRTLNFKRFAASLKEKIARLEKLEKDYMSVVAYGNGDYALMSLERLSKLYRTLSQDIQKAPGVKPEDLKPFTDPLEEKSHGFLRSCLDKATEYKIAGPGVESCRTAAVEAGVEKLQWTHEIQLEPKWISEASSDRPLLLVLRGALKAGRMGEFYMAHGLLQKAQPPVSAVENAELVNLSGLVEWRRKENQAAVRSFRQAADASDSEAGAIRVAAMKNLAALYLQVRDMSSALDMLSTLSDSDPDVAWMKGLAYRATGENEKALQAYDEGLAKSMNPNLIFNRALAAAAAGKKAEAISGMSRYIDTLSPPSSHISRTLLREWKRSPQ